MPDNPGSNQERTSRSAEDVTQSSDAPDPDSDLCPGEDITLELDADVIAWFKENEDDLDTAINAALREHMEQERQES